MSGATPNATQLIEELRWALEENRREVERLTTERDEARRLYCVRCSGSRAMEREIALKRGWVDLFPEGHGK